MKNSEKTTVFTIGLSLATIIAMFLVQIKAQGKVDILCSYLDPIIVDILAFSAGLFLVIDGIHRIWEHKDARLKNQITRSIRVALGCAILTLHIMQFIHK